MRSGLPRVEERLSDVTTSAAALRTKNMLSSVLVVFAACFIYVFAPYNQPQLAAAYGSADASFTGTMFLVVASAAYACVLVIHFLVVRDPDVSKSLRALRVATNLLLGRSRLSWKALPADDRVAVLATLLKVFFGPLMVMALLGFCQGAMAHVIDLAKTGGLDAPFRMFFDRHGFWLVMQCLLLIDVLVYTVGYLVELPQLGNRIRSVDPTLLGWAAALACYPPFNTVTAMILGSRSSDFPQFDSPTAHVILNGALLALMAIYTSASIAMGFKASNLTHRGIVSRGPYALVRHPAYTAKNLAWWIGAVPAGMVAFSVSLLDGLLVLASVLGITMLYVVRALTEEDHLRSIDGEYAVYAARVRHRFVPGLY